jgi:hypothetical protein
MLAVFNGCPAYFAHPHVRSPPRTASQKGSRLPIVVMESAKDRKCADRPRRAVFESRRTDRDPLVQGLMRSARVEVAGSTSRPTSDFDRVVAETKQHTG